MTASTARTGVDGFPAARRWRARWIWTPGMEGANQVCLFRRVVHLDALPGRILAFLTADTRYRLWINGEEVGQGAPQSQPYFQYYDERDVTACFRTGENCIAVAVQHLGVQADTRGGFLAEWTDGAGETLVGTDAAWRTVPGAAWRRDTRRVAMNQAAVFQEIFDARQLPPDWTDAAFDDAAWGGAEEIGRPPTAGPWVRLLPRDIPFMTAHRVRPVRAALTEECLDIAARSHQPNLAPELSTVGRPLEHASLEGAEALVAGEGDLVARCGGDPDDPACAGLHDPCVLLDFGKVVTGYPHLEIDGLDGASIDIGYAERLIDGRFNIVLEGEFADRVVLRDGAQHFRPFMWKAFRYLKLRFRRCTRAVRIRTFDVEVSTYPFEDAGQFESGDETLNGVFAISRETLRLCSNEFLMDTPWREQAQWLGDVAAVTLGGLRACFGDTALTGKFLRQSGANQRGTGVLANISNASSRDWLGMIPDYALWWVQALRDHWRYTGDIRYVRELYPVARRVLQLHEHYLNADGFIEDMPYWTFIDWADVDRRGECAPYNAIYCGTLEAFAELADLQADAHAASVARDLLARQRDGFEARFFDPARQRFADARIDGERSERASEHASAAAIAFGLADDATAQAIATRFYEDGDAPAVEAQPFFMIVVLRALDRIGRFDLALRLIRERWGARMVAKGFTSTTEEWSENGSRRDGRFAGFLRTHSHAWSACPAEFLIHNLAGFAVVEPGCGRVRLAPKATDFDYTVVVPTPRGSIRVERRDGGTHVEAPDSITIVEG
ncbi:MAG: family 78 glycoside hydrolase catalytic domain [Planctomycetota bacterium]